MGTATKIYLRPTAQAGDDHDLTSAGGPAAGTAAGMVHGHRLREPKDQRRREYELNTLR